ncbi:hypothetical protein CIPAW_01G050500 [Carya illinoinensis]|uniref:Uncharacterized protein n=1 Tax=Carya illinoinensis TaxID=32201 RepID=A0A8T1RI15_CARIL|nr:hypothetical protein CIPAW_01G050500 [Carya illinoinensis]
MTGPVEERPTMAGRKAGDPLCCTGDPFCCTDERELTWMMGTSLTASTGMFGGAPHESTSPKVAAGRFCDVGTRGAIDELATSTTILQPGENTSCEERNNSVRCSPPSPVPARKSPELKPAVKTSHARKPASPCGKAFLWPVDLRR